MTTWPGTPDDLPLIDLLVVILPRTRAEAMTIDRLANECHASRRDVETALQEMADSGQFPVCASSRPPMGVWWGSSFDRESDTRTITREQQYRDALIWMSGSDDFSPGGKAREGFEKIVLPLLALPEQPALDVEPCSTCKHPYIQHTGRSIWPGPEGRLPGSRLGPIPARWGGGCEALEDFHHTCACGRYARLTSPTAEVKS